MKKKLILFIFAFLLFNCSKSNKKLEYDNQKIAILDTKKLERLENFEAAEIDTDDINKIENILISLVKKYNTNRLEAISYKKENSIKMTNSENMLIDLSKYKRQYIPYINKNGHKEVWIYCMCDTFSGKSWKTDVLFSAGGGDCFFQVTLDLSNSTHRNFFINGPA